MSEVESHIEFVDRGDQSAGEGVKCEECDSDDILVRGGVSHGVNGDFKDKEFFDVFVCNKCGNVKFA